MTTRISDIIVPEHFAPYVQQETAKKSRLIQSGAMIIDPRLNTALAGGGSTFQEPSFQDLPDDEENISNDDPAVNSTPNKTNTSIETQVRLSRNNSWSSMDLAGDLAGADPLQSISTRVSSYWVRRLQAAFVATIKGVYGNNAKANPGGGASQNDMTHSVIGASFSDGVTNFNSSAFIDATLTMGDSMEDLRLVMVHSIVFGRMQKLNLIQFIPDARGEIQIPTYLGRQVIVDDSMPHNDGVFESWLFGEGAVRHGMGSPKVPAETDREPSSGNGSGEEILYNRTEWIIHPAGSRYDASAPAGGPSNAATTNNLAHEDSFVRAWPERKQIKMARLLTREFPPA